jgi:hypothetical protein
MAAEWWEIGYKGGPMVAVPAYSTSLPASPQDGQETIPVDSVRVA